MATTTFYDRAGLGDEAFMFLAAACRRLTAAFDRLEAAQPPKPLPPLAEAVPPVVEGPEGFSVAREYSRFLVLGPENGAKYWGEGRSKTGRRILDKIGPAALLEFTRKVEAVATSVEADAVAREAEVERRIAAALAAEDEAIRTIAAAIQDERAARAAAEAQRRQKDEKTAALAALKADWIAAHGSERLRRAFAEGIACDGVFRDEWLAAERPGWQFYQQIPGDVATPVNPPLEAFTLLDRARETDPNAKLAFYKVVHECDEACDHDEEGAPAYDWTGFVASSEVLDGFGIIFGYTGPAA